MSDKSENPNTPIMEELQDHDLDQVNGGKSAPGKVIDLQKDSKDWKIGYEDLVGKPLGYTEADHKTGGKGNI